MNYCVGGFTDMIHYEGLNGKQMLSSHNNCGGDILLPMVEGDHVVIEGDQEYVISELRDTSKNITTEAVNDMNGTVLLQTCYYNVQEMKFVALTPVDLYYNPPVVSTDTNETTDTEPAVPTTSPIDVIVR